MDKLTNYDDFVSNEGKREQQKIDELLDIIRKRKLTDEEKELLLFLNKGGNLPDDDKPSLATHKTGGGYLMDDEGDVLTEEEPDKPGEEFVTVKGKQRSAEKLDAENVLDARVYRNKNSENRVIHAYITHEGDSGMTNDWIIYSTAADRCEFGQFKDTTSPKYEFFKKITPEMMWKKLDYSFDYGMILDEDLYEDFMTFVTLYKEDQRKHADYLRRLRLRFVKLL